MLKKLLALLFTSVLVFSLSMPVFAQEGSKKKEAKETPAQEKAEKKVAKEVRLEGVVTRSNKDKSTLTVRKRGSSVGRSSTTTVRPSGPVRSTAVKRSTILTPARLRTVIG